MIFVCLHLVQLLMCLVVFFPLRIVVDVFLCTYLSFSPFFFLLGGPHPPTYTHPPILQGFSADMHRFTLKCWWVVGGVGWTTFRDSLQKWFILVTQGKSNNMLPFDFVHNPVWELHTSAGTPPSLLCSVASTTNFVWHNIFTSFVDRHKNTSF